MARTIDLPSSPLADPSLKRIHFWICNTMPESGTEEHEKECYHDNKILAKEIESWNNFEYALREEDRLLFNKMLSECKENEDFINAADSKDEFFSTESLFMVLIIQQQKTINELISKISEPKKSSSGKMTSWMDNTS